MKLPKRGRGRGRALALAVGIAAAAVLSLSLTAASAAQASSAGLGSSEWHPVSLPDPMAPGIPSLVSCAPGTSFCLAVGNLETLGYAAIVTTDAGASWQDYETLPAGMAYPNAASCPAADVCWLAGYDSLGHPDVAETTDGGQAWTDMTPGNWPSTWQLWSIDCVSASTCWLAGNDSTDAGIAPLVLETVDGGADWTSFSNLPVIAPYDPNGTYQLNAISCASALDCVAGGGLNEADGLAQIISTTDGGATWSLSTDPTLAGLQQIFSLSCLNSANGLPTCYAAADASAAAGPVVISSTDGGATWGGMETYDDTGWMYSISCPDTSRCWATGAGTTVGLVGTADGGNSWSLVSSDTSNEEGSVSCASVTFCVTTADNGLWQTTNGGGLGAAAPANETRSASTAAAAAAGKRLPKVSGPTVSTRAGRNTTVTGQYRAAQSGTAQVRFTGPTGKVTTGSASIGLNGYYTVTVADAPTGSTRVQVSIGGTVSKTVIVRGYPDAVPTVASLSAHAGPARGGTTVTISGSGLAFVRDVYFGARLAGHLHVVSAREIKVTAPAGTGKVPVKIVTAGGTTPLVKAGYFSY